MKPILLFLFLSLVQFISAQNFTEMRFAPFDELRGGRIAFSDVDGDMDEDLLISGSNNADELIAKMYINNGSGSFTEKTGAPFEAITPRAFAFSDVDGDNDPDLFVMSEESTGHNALFYINDGMGNFAERMRPTSVEGLSGSSMAFSDVDGDMDEDLFVTGFDTADSLISKLYINDGMGNFSEKTGMPIVAVQLSSVAFSDVDGDNDSDLFIIGLANPFRRTAKLYLNDGLGNFTEETDVPFDSVFQGSIAFSDVDGNNSPDLLITGFNSSSERIAKLYTNDGEGNFTEKMGTPFDGVFRGSVAFSDVDGDGVQDLLLTGMNDSRERIAKLYINDGLGNFSEKSDTPFEGVLGGTAAIFDVDGDRDGDVLITGTNISGEKIAKLYINDSLSSTNELRNNFSFDLQPYPNPAASDKLYINYNSVTHGEVKLAVYDMKASLVLEERKFTTSGEQVLTIDIAFLTQGSYLLKLDDGSKKGVTQFIVE